MHVKIVYENAKMERIAERQRSSLNSGSFPDPINTFSENAGKLQYPNEEAKGGS